LKYELFIERAAQRALGRLPQSDQARIVEAIRGLAVEPRPRGAKKLRGREAWRIRSGDYRVIYEIDDERRRVLVVTIGHRRDIYRR
jgi:mRNA interferase RelE/StbE